MVLSCRGREHFLEALLSSIPGFSLRPDEILTMVGPEDIGTKRQRALELARGDIIVILDDDDWQHPHRIAKQVGTLLGRPGAVVGTTKFYVHDQRSGRTTYSRTWGGATCMPAGTLAFWRAPALEVGFPPGLGAEEHLQFGWRARFGDDAVIDLEDPSLFVHRRHGNNASSDSWVLNLCDVPKDELRSTLGEHWIPEGAIIQ